MNKTTRYLLGSGVLVVGAAAIAGATLADGGWGRHHGGDRHGGRAMMLFERFDVNEDGRLTQAEIDEVRQSRLAEFDQDGDGSLTLEEYQALWLDAMRERMVRAFQRHDRDGDALVTAEEFGRPFDRAVSRFDRDGDGELTLDEMRRRGERPGGRNRDRESRGGDDDG